MLCYKIHLRYRTAYDRILYTRHSEFVHLPLFRIEIAGIAVRTRVEIDRHATALAVAFLSHRAYQCRQIVFLSAVFIIYPDHIANAVA